MSCICSALADLSKFALLKIHLLLARFAKDEMQITSFFLLFSISHAMLTRLTAALAKMHFIAAASSYQLARLQV